MKKSLLFIIAITLSIEVIAQTSKPISDQILIGKITKSTITHHDFEFQGRFGTCWVNQYNGKYYSNYPFKVIFSKSKYKIYKFNKLVNTGSITILKITNTKVI